LEENHLLAALGSRNCPACESTVSFKRGQKNGFEMLTCTRCSTLYTSQLPGAESVKNYDDYYRDENLSAPEFVNRRLHEIVSDFSAYKQHNRLLDVGFGAGTLLEAARNAGFEAFGLEVSERAVTSARAMGFEVFCGTIQEAQYPENYFDVVTASEVLEHVPDPKAVLQEIARVLRPDGLLWLTTPHGRGLSGKLLGLKWSVVCPPDHLQLFSRSGGLGMLKAAGLRPIRVAVEGLNPYELLRLGKTPEREPGANNESEGNTRVESSYRLNEALMASRPRRLVKRALNGLLNLGRLGDSLKIWAEK
jgi:SAM-dependent methyltransferase